MFRNTVRQFPSVRTVFCFIAVIYLLSFSAKAIVNQKTVYGDGRYYYSWLHTILIDHDIDFRNEYREYGINEPDSASGLPRNVYSLGPSLFWIPAFAWVRNIFGSDGYGFGYQFVVGFANVLSVIAGLAILYKTLQQYFEKEVSVLTILGIAFATNLFFYGSLDTVNSHSISFFLSTVVLHIFLNQKNPFVLGLFIGLLTLMRTQDALFLLLLLPSFSFIQLILGTLGFVTSLSPQLASWQLLYGTMTKSPYLDADHIFTWFQPHLVDVLISPLNGLFYWTPILALATLGFFVPRFPRSPPKYLFLGIIALQLYVIASWSFWWQGESYSGRMFISVLPLFAFGLASILSGLKRQHSIGMVTIFSFVNISAIVLYLVTH